MVGKLITLPVRVPLRSAQLLTRAAGKVAGRAVSLTGQAIQVFMPGQPDFARSAQAPRPTPPTPQAERPAAPRKRPAPQRKRPTPQPDEPAEEAVSPAGVEHPSAPGAPVAEAPTEWTEEPLAPLVEEPAHVSQETELVQESAEPGAEEGAGAGVSVVEPWDGYGHMSAQDVIDRARTANVAELAAMRLYEARHRARQTVLTAVDRQLRLANGGRMA